MSDPPPASLLITPDLRRRLQQRYEQALRLAAQSAPNYGEIHASLAECVRSDPGSILYLDALLANLRRWKPTRKQSWLPKWLRRRTQAAAHGGLDSGHATPPSAPSTPDDLLRRAPELLFERSGDVALLRQLAHAAGECDFDEVEMRYFAAARAAAPDDPVILLDLARTLSRCGQFSEAVGLWFAVQAMAPSAESEQAIEDLRGAEIIGEPMKDASPADAAQLLRYAEHSRDYGDFARAEHYLAEAQAMAGGNLKLFHEREEVRLARSESHLALARKRAEHDPHPRAQSLVQRLEVEHNRLEIDIWNMRAERMPEDVSVRIELARRLKRAGNFSGATQRLEEALRLQPDDPAALVELGECWQHLRQFQKALDYYRRAAESNPLRDATALPPQDVIEAMFLASYRAGVLAAAMGDPAAARGHLKWIVAIDSTYKDAKQRLDNLPRN